MATVTASSILSRASVLLMDIPGTRWAETELLSWLNLGQRDIVSQRPEAYVSTRDVALAAGTRQTIPDDAVRLIRVIRNTLGRAVSLANPEMLDAEDPNWHTGSPSSQAVHYIYDQHDPRTYYVYPPNDGSGRLEVAVCAAPPDVVSAGNVISIDDVYANALLDYVMYRALAKDTGSAANLTRANLFYQSYTASLTGKVKADTASNPNLNTRPVLGIPPEAKLS